MTRKEKEKKRESSERQWVLTAAQWLEWISLSSIVAAYTGDIYIMLTPNEDPSLFNVAILSLTLSLFAKCAVHDYRKFVSLTHASSYKCHDQMPILIIN